MLITFFFGLPQLIRIGLVVTVLSLSGICLFALGWKSWLILLAMLSAFKLYLIASLGVCTSKNRLDGKTVIITGANAGIGKETAIELAKRGAKVVLACRDLKKASVAREHIVAESGNNNVIVRHLDLASLSSVRKFADDYKRSESRLDILINNAGCALMGKKLTDDGLEYQMQSNHFGHFLLTNLLLGIMNKAENARIINVSSNAHKLCKHLDVNDLNFERDDVAKTFLKIYGITKLCNILFTRELARRIQSAARSGVTVNALHPGVVHTEFGRFMALPRSVTKIADKIFGFFCKTSMEGAQTTIHLAVADEVVNVTGEYFRDCKIVETSKLAKDMRLAKKLWEASESLVNLTEEERHF